MTKPFFFDRASGLTLGDIASITGAEHRPDIDVSCRIVNIAPLELAGPGDLAYIDNKRYVEALASTNAGACLMAESFEKHAPRTLVVLRTREPYRAFVAVARSLFPDSLRPSSLFEAEGVAAGAFVHSSAKMESGAIIDPGAVIGPRAEVGTRTVIGANAVVTHDIPSNAIAVGVPARVIRLRDGAPRRHKAKPVATLSGTKLRFGNAGLHCLDLWCAGFGKRHRLIPVLF